NASANNCGRVLMRTLRRRQCSPHTGRRGSGPSTNVPEFARVRAALYPFVDTPPCLADIRAPRVDRVARRRAGYAICPLNTTQDEEPPGMGVIGGEYGVRLRQRLS